MSSALFLRSRALRLAYARRHGLDAEEALDAVHDSFITFLGLPEAQSIAHDPSRRAVTIAALPTYSCKCAGHAAPRNASGDLMRAVLDSALVAQGDSP